MIIKNMQWGYDGGGIACGPVSGSDVVELTIVDGAKKRYILVSKFCEFEKVLVHKKSLFSAAIDADFDALLAEEEKAEAVYDYELPELPDEMRDSAYYPAIKLARMAMKEWLQNGESEEASAAEFIAPYIGKEAADLALEEISYWDEDEEEEE